MKPIRRKLILATVRFCVYGSDKAIFTVKGK